MRSAQQFLALGAVLATVVLAACGASGTGASTAPTTPSATARPSAQPTSRPTTQPTTAPTAKPTTKPSTTTGTVVNLGNTALGHVLVDAKGITLYLWAHDKGSTSTCNGDCAEYWPPLLTKGAPAVNDGLMSSLIGTSRRSDGSTQVTFNGHPLYYFVQDTKAGDTNGEGLTGFGGRWDPVSATGAAVRGASMAVGSKVDAIDALAVSDQSDQDSDGNDGRQPLAVRVIAPRAHSTAGDNGTFSVDLTIQARNRASNSLLAGYAPGFIDPNSPQFHPGSDAFAPGLVVLLSTTPNIAGTPLQGANTNLAGVFQINDTSLIDGRKGTFNSWLVGVPGFFGQGVNATLTVFVVDGTAPAVVDGSEHAISNVVHETFTIAS